MASVFVVKPSSETAWSRSGGILTVVGLISAMRIIPYFGVFVTVDTVKYAVFSYVTDGTTIEPLVT